MNTEKEIQALKDEIKGLRSELSQLTGAFYKNNFGSTQTFNKDAIFSSRLRVPVYSGAPTVAEVGDLIAVSGTLYICTDDNPVTFTVVGTQS